MRKQNWLAALGGLALVMTACGSASDRVTTGPANEAALAGEQGSPLETLLGIPGGGEASEAYFSELMRNAEAAIATCMLEQGFTYIPMNSDALISAEADVDASGRAFAEQYGFGIASNPFDEVFEQLDATEDPNGTYVSSLTDGERDAYEQALYGAVVSEAGLDEDSELGGCQSDAFDKAFSTFDVFENYGNQLDEIGAAYASDPRIVKASAGWSSCMADGGFRFTDEAGARADIERRYDAILSDPSAFLSDDEAFEQAAVAASEGDTIIIGPQSLTPQAQAKVDELAIEERALATASWDCSAGLRDIEDDVWREYEQRFVDQYGDQIAAELSAG